MGSHCVSGKLDEGGNRRTERSWRWFPNFLHYQIHGQCLMFLSSRMEVFFITTHRCIYRIPRIRDSGCCIAYTGVVLFWLPAKLVLLPFNCIAEVLGMTVCLAELELWAPQTRQITVTNGFQIHQIHSTGNLNAWNDYCISLFLFFCSIILTTWPGTGKKQEGM